MSRVGKSVLMWGAVLIAASAAALIVLRSDHNVNAEAGSAMEPVKLTSPKTDSAFSLEKAISARRSVRSYLDEPLNPDELSQLLWAAQGITAPDGRLRAAPSAGATYPLEVYAVCGRVEGLPAGVYKYSPREHTMTLHIEGDQRVAVAEAALGQSLVRDAAISLILTAVRGRTAARYGDRADRYVDIEIGHAGQNVLLQATALGLGSCPVGAFDDNRLKRTLRLPAEEQPKYIVPVGRVTPRAPGGAGHPAP